MKDMVELNVNAGGQGSLKVNGVALSAQSVVIRVNASRGTEIVVTLPPHKVMASVETENLKILGFTRDEKGQGS